jgi:hypothetical protein
MLDMFLKSVQITKNSVDNKYLPTSYQKNLFSCASDNVSLCNWMRLLMLIPATYGKMKSHTRANASILVTQSRFLVTALTINCGLSHVTCICESRCQSMDGFSHSKSYV